MGIADIRDAFKQVARPAYSCSTAYHRYTRDVEEGETQMLEFRGRDQNGAEFSIEAPDLPAGADLQAIAAQTAKRLLEKGNT